MTSSQSTTPVLTSGTGVSDAVLLGKRKEPPMSPQSTNVAVDAAFKRLFGYSWGTKFDLPTNSSNSPMPSSIESEMVQIFGPTRTARILNLPWNVVAPISPNSNSLSKEDYYNPAAILTTKIVAMDSKISSSTVSSSSASMSQIDSSKRRNKKMRLENYKSIALPSHMTSASSSNTALASDAQASGPSSVTMAATKNHTNTAPASVAASNLDNVLSQIAGKKQLNTVEKSSNDWEGFKETDKTLQDELERTAQSKNAYLVKQDFLNRVDHRKFELEKEERDRERSRRATESSR